MEIKCTVEEFKKIIAPNAGTSDANVNIKFDGNLENFAKSLNQTLKTQLSDDKE